MDHENFKSIDLKNVKTQSLDKTSVKGLKLGSYSLPNSSDLSSFFKEAGPVLGNYIGKGVEIARGPVSSDSPIGRKELSNKLIREIYPRLTQVKGVKEMDIILQDLYTAYPSSRGIMDEVKGNFGTSGGGVMAIPPVIVGALVVYAIGYAIGYSQS